MSEKWALSCPPHKGVVRPGTLHRAWLWWEHVRCSLGLFRLSKMSLARLAHGAKKRHQISDSPELQQTSQMMAGPSEHCPALTVTTLWHAAGHGGSMQPHTFLLRSEHLMGSFLKWGPTQDQGISVSRNHSRCMD